MPEITINDSVFIKEQFIQSFKERGKHYRVIEVDLTLKKAFIQWDNKYHMNKPPFWIDLEEIELTGKIIKPY